MKDTAMTESCVASNVENNTESTDQSSDEMERSRKLAERHREATLAALRASTSDAAKARQLDQDQPQIDERKAEAHMNPSSPPPPDPEKQEHLLDEARMGILLAHRSVVKVARADDRRKLRQLVRMAEYQVRAAETAPTKQIANDCFWRIETLLWAVERVVEDGVELAEPAVPA